jgi:hypothetical protein
MSPLGQLLSSMKPAQLTTMGMLEKATIVILDYREGFEIPCQFNPTKLSVTKEAVWSVSTEDGEKDDDMAVAGRNAPDLEFGGGKPATFSLEVVFDTTQESSSSFKDVRMYTNELLKLTMLGAGDKSKGDEPPHVMFMWGELLMFEAVVSKVQLEFTLFLPNGTPVRAKAQVEFMQDDDEDDVDKSTNPTTRTEARKTHIVQQGERLDMIAYQEYGHPMHWRDLAQANGLQNPLDLKAGQILRVPKLNG